VEQGYIPLSLIGITAGTPQDSVSKEGYITEEREARVLGGDIILLIVNLGLAPTESASGRAGK
jgi:hypothetical protein